MKCLKRQTPSKLKVVRVSDRKAAKLLKKGWLPCSKKEYKKYVHV